MYVCMDGWMYAWMYVIACDTNTALGGSGGKGAERGACKGYAAMEAAEEASLPCHSMAERYAGACILLIGIPRSPLPTHTTTLKERAPPYP